MNNGKYSEDIVDSICAYLEHGLVQKDAAILSGIDEATFYRWIKDHASFASKVELALSAYKEKLIRLVHFHAASDGKLAFEILARRWPEQYGPTARFWVPEQKETGHDRVQQLMDIINKNTTEEVVVEGEEVPDKPQDDSEQVQPNSTNLLPQPGG